MGKIRDLTGHRFGRLTVLKILPKDGLTKRRWVCKCDCGNTHITYSIYLTKGWTKSCGCYRKEISAPNNARIGALKTSLPPGEAGKRDLYYRYKKQALDRAYVFEINEETFSELTKQKCHYCLKIPSQVSSSGSWSSKNSPYIYNGIDRKNNTKGYTLDNCVSCCSNCNSAKRAKSYEQFMEETAHLRAPQTNITEIVTRLAKLEEELALLKQAA